MGKELKPFVSKVERYDPIAEYARVDTEMTLKLYKFLPKEPIEIDGTCIEINKESHG